MKNKIAKLVEVGKIEIFEEELPKLKEDEVLVKIKYCDKCMNWDKISCTFNLIGPYSQSIIRDKLCKLLQIIFISI